MVTMNEKRQTEGLQAIVREARKAEEGVIRLLDRLSKIRWPLEAERVGDALDAQTTGLCLLNAQLSRIAILAGHAIPAYDEGAYLDNLVAEASSCEDRDS